MDLIDFEDVKNLIPHKGNIFGGLVCYIRALYIVIPKLEIIIVPIIIATFVSKFKVTLFTKGLITPIAKSIFE